MTSEHPTSNHPWHADRRGTRPTRQHSPCPTCYADCTNDNPEAILTFTCPRGHTHQNTRGASIQNGAWLTKLYIGPREAGT